ncbi:sterile alpha motif domain-containing protein 1-like [Schistocerca nitens]|uniref:sterile alpha motif domain-containing protein 1-like n=1 Tax=Schistocerca nitens TaxID=7011 RepID=UPI002119288B|nr:sterile alpha motif domain-containing protein 1-like [Schistocerca nitens]
MCATAGEDVGPSQTHSTNMYRIPVGLLCLLSVAASAGDANTRTATDSTPVSVNTTLSSSDNLIPCEKSADCGGLPGPHACFNGTCYDCYDCCSLKKAHCPRRRCYCTWFLTDEELKIVAQAVLGVAVFVTCVALLSLLWKMCARRLRRRRRVAAAAGADLLDDADAASLSSQQVFVVERLRDRPPRYEEAARDFAVEKPPPYSEVVVEEVQWPRQTVRVGGVAGGVTARDFAAPPPYSPPPQRADADAASLAPPPPPQPPTPPVQRLRRCVRKVVVIGRLVRRSSAEPEADCSSRPPKGLPQPQPLPARAAPGLPTASASASASAASEPEPGAAAEQPGSPTSTAA